MEKIKTAKQMKRETTTIEAGLSEQIKQLQADKAELVEALREAEYQINELCTILNIPKPEASMSRYAGLAQKHEVSGYE